MAALPVVLPFGEVGALIDANSGANRYLTQTIHIDLMELATTRPVYPGGNPVVFKDWRGHLDTPLEFQTVLNAELAAIKASRLKNDKRPTERGWGQ